MTAPSRPRRIGNRLGHWLRRDDSGASLVEYALTVALFLLLFFALLDFGRLLYNWNMAQKATQMAARVAAVRPPVCAGVPQSNLRLDATSTLPFGTSCGALANLCVAQTVTCAGNTASATASEVWARIRPIMPGNAGPQHLRYTYTFDPNMNFLGGPYVPVVTVEIQNLEFEFISPLYGLARVAGATFTGNDMPANVPFPSMSVSLPGEDLALGDAG